MAGIFFKYQVVQKVISITIISVIYLFTYNVYNEIGTNK